MSLSIINLSIKQLKYIYKVSYRFDFPEAERKPLAMLIGGLKRGNYKCLGLVEGEEILGYAFFFQEGEDFLLDYFAILSKYRNRGLGSGFLKELEKHDKAARNVLIEVEDPECATNHEEATLQKRRLDFYYRNGCEDTGVRSLLFGVNYIILRISNGIAFSDKQIADLYMTIYHDMLPARLFKGNVAIR